jgi:hypothetical protein
MANPEAPKAATIPASRLPLFLLAGVAADLPTGNFLRN